MKEKDDYERLAQISRHLNGELDINLGERLSLGNVCQYVFRGTQGKKSVVVKIGLNELEKREIRMNRKGYKKMEEIGATSLAPLPIFNFEFGEALVIVMQDCGLDFWHRVQFVSDPVGLYRKLISSVFDIYETTKRVSFESVNSLCWLLGFLMKQYQDYLFPFFGANDELICLLSKIKMEEYTPKWSCFSTFDFTPEDVFLTSEGLKYVDPLPNLIGVPVIDMACFSGVARDAYGLPGSSEGYFLLKQFAITNIPDLLGLDYMVSEKLFALGRALQCALSSRFRIDEDRQKAFSLFDLSCKYSMAFLEGN